MLESLDGAAYLIGLALAAAALVGAGVLFLRSRNAGRAAPDALPRPLAELPVLVVDLETTGLDVRTDRVVSIGAIIGEGGRMDRDEALDVLVNPDCRVPPRSTAIHGITDDMVADAPRFTEAFDQFDAMLSGRVMVGHNIGYDLAILRGECQRLGLAWSPPPALDIVRLAAALEPRERDLTLEGMAGRWGITVAGRHTALGDALMAGEMWRYLLPRLADAGVFTLSDALAFERRARAVIAHQKRAGW